MQAAYCALLRQDSVPAGGAVEGWLITTAVRLAYRKHSLARRQLEVAALLAVEGRARSAERIAEVREETPVTESVEAPDRIRLPVREGEVISGLVYVDGEPRAGVEVIARCLPFVPLELRTTTSDADGRFHLSGLIPRTRYRLAVRSGDLVLGERTEQSVVSGYRDVRLDLIAGGCVGGRVLAGEGRTLAGMRVALERPIGLPGGRSLRARVVDGAGAPVGRVLLSGARSVAPTQDTSGTRATDDGVLRLSSIPSGATTLQVGAVGLAAQRTVLPEAESEDLPPGAACRRTGPGTASAPHENRGIPGLRCELLIYWIG